MPPTRNVVPNRFFIACPWKSIRPKYEQVVNELREEFPVDCVIVGRTTGQDAQELWTLIKKQIEESVTCIFDATGSNANIALEFGYAEALGKRCVLAICEHCKTTVNRDPTIISDLAGKVRTQWKTVTSLKEMLRREFEENSFIARFQDFVGSAKYGKKKSRVAVSAIRELSGRQRMMKPDLIVAVQRTFATYNSIDVRGVIDELGESGILAIKRGRHGGVSVPRILAA